MVKRSSFRRPRRFGYRSALALFLGALSATGGLVATPPATAAPPLFAEIGNPSGFHLTTDDTSPGNIWGKNQGLIKSIEESGSVTNASPLTVAESAQHKGQSGLCLGATEHKLNPRYVPDGFCWDDKDGRSSNWDTVVGGWVPQGLTASHDAVPGGTVEGRHLYAASWYYGKNKSQNEFARVSFVKNDGVNNVTTYGHVLLVEPTDGSFRAVKNTHADGMVWYGNRLFVANGGELQVYDMRHLWRMKTTGSEAVGVHDGVSSARWHQWAMPMIGRYWTGAQGADPRACSKGETDLCLGSLSLDRSGDDSLVSGEYVQRGAGGRVVRWPLNAAVALPRAQDGSGIGTAFASAAYATPVWAMQGVATDGQYYYMAGQCPPRWNPPDVPADSGEAFSCIHRARPGENSEVFTMAPRMTQNLSYAPNSGRLWGLNEKINSARNQRLVFSIDVKP
ncbi:hypothetical protein [Streptomyces sp. NPDC002564]|uniref:hypothetical protein n=1 Tax=Streptomyces sp. NPDC002564 TaxID=3364649 RepID=UPI00367FE8D3